MVDVVELVVVVELVALSTVVDVVELSSGAVVVVVSSGGSSWAAAGAARQTEATTSAADSARSDEVGRGGRTARMLPRGPGVASTSMERTLFDEEHELFRDSFRRFVADEITPNLDHWEAEGIADRSLFANAGRHGFLGMAVPEAHGGGGVNDFRYNQVVIEEVQAAGAGGAGLGLTLHNDICLPYFLSLTTEEQKARWLPGIASGELITAIAMTEPGIGSDLASMRTTAVRDGDNWVVNGSKTFITNGINADLVIVACKTDPTQRHAGMSLLVVERGMDGFERGRNLDKIGMHSQDTAELFFNDVAVPGRT